MKIRYCDKWDKDSRELAAEFCRKYFISKFKGSYTLELLRNGIAIKLDVRPWRNEDDFDYEDVVVFFIRKDGLLDCNTYTNYYGDHVEYTGRPKDAEEMMEHIRTSGLLAIIKT